MAGVPRILLDHVDENVAHGDGAVVERHLPAEIGLFEGVEPFVGLANLGSPGGEGDLDHRGIGPCRREVPVGVALTLVEARRSVRPCSTRWNQWFST